MLYYDERNCIGPV